jgi:hypothetical protein
VGYVMETITKYTKMPQWEYRVISNISESDLDLLGAQGWELTAIIANTYTSDIHYYYFKRDKKYKGMYQDHP